MMRSLWSGVSGLQSHQTAMDVEGHNISNVNTVGYKRSRVSFSEQVSQNYKTATSPENDKAGRNPMQVGLGTQVQAVTKVFSAGSIETTEVGTDLAIRDDGFFVISDDGGKTRRYTRNGEFSFDAHGNYSNKTGFTVQGWMANEETHMVDESAPIKDIVIPPGLTLEAMATNKISLKANLNSGYSVGDNHIKPVSSLDSFHDYFDSNKNKRLVPDEQHAEDSTTIYKFNNKEQIVDNAMDFNVIFDPKGDSLKLRENQGIWMSYKPAKVTSQTDVGALTDNIDFTLNGSKIEVSLVGSEDEKVQSIVNAINKKTNKTGVVASVTMAKVQENGVTKNKPRITLTNDNATGTTEATKNIIFTNLDNAGGLFTTNHNRITAYKYQYTSGTPDQTAAKGFELKDIIDNTNYINDYHAIAEKVNAVPTGNQQKQEQAKLITAALSSFPQDLQDKIKAANGDDATIKAFQDYQKELPKLDEKIQNALTNQDGLNQTPRQFRTTEDLRHVMHLDAMHVGNSYNDSTPKVGEWYKGIMLADVTLNDQGQMKITKNTNKNTPGLNMVVTGFSDNSVVENRGLTNTFQAIQGIIDNQDASRVSQGMFAATHAAAVDVYDSLGSKHDIMVNFTKIATSEENGTEWAIKVSVAEPGQINDTGEGPRNIVMGYVKFDNTGALSSYSPTNISFSPNNGSAGEQPISLDFGRIGFYDGVTSNDRAFNTENFGRNGYAAGTLNQINIDEGGNVIGSFTNSQSRKLAKVALATFTNNEGLQAIGDNMFSDTANSGNAIIGAAGTGSRGVIKSSALEMSNVDLSRSLTQLIVIQRGFQANSKTITTSDQMLNTLLQLKQ